MKAKVVIRNVGIIMLMLAVGLTAFGFISDNSETKDKVALNATEIPEVENTDTPAAKATEDPSQATETPDITSTPTEIPQSTEKADASSTENPSSTDVPEVNATAAPDTVPEPQPTATQLPPDESEADKVKTYTLVVSKGMSAMQIANRLEENGIVRDSEEFLQLVVSKNAHNDINVGSYEFTSNHTYDQIISALTGKKK